MAHTIRDRSKLLSRVKRIRGQVEALERAIDQNHDCSQILQQIAACRGAVNGLMAEVLEGHIREHLIDPSRLRTRSEDEALEDLVQVMKRYIK